MAPGRSKTYFAFFSYVCYETPLASTESLEMWSLMCVFFFRFCGRPDPEEHPRARSRGSGRQRPADLPVRHGLGHPLLGQVVQKRPRVLQIRAQRQAEITGLCTERNTRRCKLKYFQSCFVIIFSLVFSPDTLLSQTCLPYCGLKQILSL